MDVYPVYDKDNKVMFAFEINNFFITLKHIKKILLQSKNIKNVRIRKLFSMSIDVHIRFEFFEQEYIVLEPWGDSSRYWIGPEKNSSILLDIEELKVLFEKGS